VQRQGADPYAVVCPLTLRCAHMDQLFTIRPDCQQQNRP
jgi:hypothetical protein